MCSVGRPSAGEDRLRVVVRSCSSARPGCPASCPERARPVFLRKVPVRRTGESGGRADPASVRFPVGKEAAGRFVAADAQAECRDDGAGIGPDVRERPERVAGERHSKRPVRQVRARCGSVRLSEANATLFRPRNGRLRRSCPAAVAANRSPCGRGLVAVFCIDSFLPPVSLRQYVAGRCEAGARRRR